MLGISAVFCTEQTALFQPSAPGGGATKWPSHARYTHLCARHLRAGRRESSDEATATAHVSVVLILPPFFPNVRFGLKAVCFGILGSRPPYAGVQRERLGVDVKLCVLLRARSCTNQWGF